MGIEELNELLEAWPEQSRSTVTERVPAFVRQLSSFRSADSAHKDEPSRLSRAKAYFHVAVTDFNAESRFLFWFLFGRRRRRMAARSHHAGTHARSH